MDNTDSEKNKTDILTYMEIPLVSNTEQNTTTNITTDNEKELAQKKMHRTFRTIFIIIWILLSISVLLFLFYQNGKSLYAQGS